MTMEHLISAERLRAGANIIRWNGWMHRPVNIIHHSIAMANTILELTGDDLTARYALLHDLHETEIMGDLPTPDKARYVNARYHHDIDLFDTRLVAAANLPSMVRADPETAGTLVNWQNSPLLKVADAVATVVENEFYVTRKDPAKRAFSDSNVWDHTMRRHYEALFGVDHAHRWYEVWDSLA